MDDTGIASRTRTSGTSGTSGTLGTLGTLSILLVFAAIAASGIFRPGYSIDEEYTLFGVRGIGAHGVPIVPSGALYDRGLPYTYAAWLAGVLFGHGFPAYRLPSLLSAVIAIVLAFRLARIAQSSAALALIATAATAALPWTIFSAQWARFYAMFIAVMLASVLLFVRSVRAGRGVWWWLASIWLAHLLHEFAILLVLLPVCAWMLDAQRTRAGFPFRLTTLGLAAFLAGEITVAVLHFTVSGEPFRTMHDYAALHALPVGWELPGQAGADRPYLLFDPERWWHVLGALPLAAAGAVIGALIARRLRVPPLLGGVQGALTAVGQFARIWLVTVLWVFARPHRLVRILSWTAAVVTIGALILTVQSLRGTGTMLSWPLVSGILAFAFREALSTISALLLEYPGTMVCLAAAAILTTWRQRSGSAARIRLLLLWVFWWLLAFDVLRVDFKPRYYEPFWVVLVMSVVPAAWCIPAAWFARRRVALAVRVAVALVMAATMVREQYSSVDENRSSACAAAGSICVPRLLAYDTSSVGTLRDRVSTADIVLCGDELLCDLELGRTDYWLYTGTIFRHATPAGAIGLYGGAPIVSTLTDLQTLLQRAQSTPVWIVMPALRKYETWSVEEIVAAIPEPRRNTIEVTQSAGATVIEIR